MISPASASAPRTITLAQYAGYNRAIREAANSPVLRPQALIKITNPLIMKNSRTPYDPNIVTALSAGNAFGVPHARVSPKWNNTTPSAATNRSKSSTRNRCRPGGSTPLGSTMAAADGGAEISTGANIS
ncbi:hypothetical protein Acor_81080 [Acrocarpospora corrugata]|uniref:Uncharacterized protein n=1 Tax=Acrocarpospora corrugata TaxID=35763 RepID=A0A5M3WCG4_9ACTN|nr:hypothetical protein Acor_81080 [Acrocarpospora corrugata]